MKEYNVLNVVYHSSDLFAPVLGTSMVSLLENNKEFDGIHFYIFENPLSQENKHKIIELTKKYNRNITFLPMPDVNKQFKLGLADVNKKGWFFNSYIKLFLDQVLPNDVHRVLYLDSDTLVLGSLKDLYTMDLGGKPAAAVMDCLGERYYNLLNLDAQTRYCNSGVILIDIPQWKKQGCGEKIKHYIEKENGYVFFMEQTAFNGGLTDSIFILDPKYNSYSMIQHLSYKQIIRLRKVKRFYSLEEIDNARTNPVIVHLTNSFLLINRSWYERSNHKFTEKYIEYKQMTPWCNEPLFTDRRPLKQKALDFFVIHLPKFLLIPLASFAYNVIRVRKIKRIQNKNKKGKKNEN